MAQAYLAVAEKSPAPEAVGAKVAWAWASVSVPCEQQGQSKKTCPCGPDCPCGADCKCGDKVEVVMPAVAGMIGSTEGVTDALAAPVLSHAYVRALGTGKPFVTWVGTDCPPCRAATPYVTHVHVQSLPGFTAPCAVVAFPDGGEMKYLESEVLYPPFEDRHTASVVYGHFRGVTATAQVATGGVTCGPNGCTTGACVSGNCDSGACALGSCSSGACATATGGGCASCCSAQGSGGYGSGASFGGHRHPVLRVLGAPFRAFHGRRGGCASCGG